MVHKRQSQGVTADSCGRMHSMKSETTRCDSSRLPDLLRWTWQGRMLVFFLSASSIWCLLAEMYKLCSMRTFTFSILIPATFVLVVMAIMDRMSGDGRLWRAVLIGAAGGFLAACTYDIFRLPWVIGYTDKIGPLWLRLPLFRVFPRFGAMILGEPFTAAQADGQFSLSAHVTGWVYHFSNGVTFGIMYLAMVGDARRRSWLWAVALATFLELAMLFTPYPGFFAIRVTALFVAVTLMAHLLFGVSLGLYAKHKSLHWPAMMAAGGMA